MVFNPNPPDGSQQEQKGIVVLPCYDELIAFLKAWFVNQKRPQRPIFEVDRYTGLSAAYQSIVKWTVSSDAQGLLKTISMATDDYDNSTWQVTIAGVNKKDFQIVTALSIEYDGLVLQPDSVVEVLVKSDGANSIKADAIIVGREIKLT